MIQDWRRFLDMQEDQEHSMQEWLFYLPTGESTERTTAVRRIAGVSTKFMLSSGCVDDVCLHPTVSHWVVCVCTHSNLPYSDQRNSDVLLMQLISINHKWGHHILHSDFVCFFMCMNYCCCSGKEHVQALPGLVSKCYQSSLLTSLCTRDRSLVNQPVQSWC